MPAPQAKQIESDITQYLQDNGFWSANIRGQSFSSGPKGAWKLFIEALTRDWTEAWQKWQDGHSAFLGNNIPVVAGKGTGVGGKVLETVVVDFIIRWPYRRHQRFFEFEEALVTVLMKEFSIWSKTFTCLGLPYAGSSTHTSKSPGVFNITNVPTPLKAAGEGDPPDNIRPQVEAILKGKGWNVSSPFYKTGIFLDSIDFALEKNFAEWLEKTKIIGDTSTGPASPGAGVGVGVSLNTGKLV